MSEDYTIFYIIFYYPLATALPTWKTKFIPRELNIYGIKAYVLFQTTYIYLCAKFHPNASSSFCVKE